MTNAVDCESPSREGSKNGSSPSGKRSFFGFGKKKKGQPSPSSSPQEERSPTLDPIKESDPVIATAVARKASQLPQLTSIPPITTSPPPVGAARSARAQSPTSPIRSISSNSSATPNPRPSTGLGSSPRLSTSSSQIFERNVQEQASIPPSTSPAIPAHIQTDNHIPAVLEASSIAITDRDCDVDEVEIVMHSMHQPAASVVASHHSSSPVYENNRHNSPTCTDNTLDDLAASSGDELSSYGTSVGAAAVADKRRLSFISFADVVQAEQAEHPAGSSGNFFSSNGSPVSDPITISAIAETLRRSPSPVRALGTSPTRNPGGYFATASPIERSISERSVNSRGASSPPRMNLADSLALERGELTVETMGQALRKTGSGDFSGYLTGKSLVANCSSPDSVSKVGDALGKRDGW